MLIIDTFKSKGKAPIYMCEHGTIGLASYTESDGMITAKIIWSDSKGKGNRIVAVKV